MERLSPYGSLVQEWSDTTWKLKIRGLLLLLGSPERTKDLDSFTDNLIDPRLQYDVDYHTGDNVIVKIKDHWLEDFKSWAEFVKKLIVKEQYPIYGDE